MARDIFGNENPFLAGPEDRPQGTFPPLAPEEQESVLNSLGQRALSGLQWVGQTLGKPGRAARGLLAGHPEALANLIPFSDTLGITDPANDVSGRELGGMGKGVPGSGLELEDVLGFGIEMATDPLSWLTAGGLTAAGKAAQKGGTLAKTLAERIGAGQAGLVGIRGLPVFGEATGVGTGATSQAIAKQLGKGYDWARFSKPGIALGNLFDATRQPFGVPAQTPEGIQAMQEYSRRAPQAIAEAQDATMKTLQEAGKPPGIGENIRAVVEGGQPTQPLTPGEQALADRFSQSNQQMLGQEIGAGINVGNRENYMHRQGDYLPTETIAQARLGGKQVASTMDRSQIGREAIMDPGMTGQTALINQLTVDPNVSGIAFNDPYKLDNLGQQVQYILNKTGKYDEGEHLSLLGAGPNSNPVNAPGSLRHQNLRALAAAGNASPGDLAELARIDRLGELNELKSRAEGAADWLARLDPRRAQEGIPFFGRNVVKDQLAREASHGKLMTLADVLTDTLTTASKNPRAAQQALGVTPADPKLTDTLKALGFTDEARKVMASKMGLQNVTDLADVRIPQKLHDDLTRVVQGFTQPAALSPVINAYDSMSNLFKSGVTTLFPARYARIAMQQLWNMFVHGQNPMRAIDGLKAARWGDTLPFANKVPDLAHLTPEAASDALRREMFAYKVAGPEKITRDADMAGQPLEAALSHRDLQLPGDQQPTLAQIGKSAIPRNMEEAKPWNLFGVGGKTETKFAPARAGREADRWIDDATRGGSYIDLRLKGWAPAEAARKVNEIHYDFSNLTGFEKSTMRRLLPFYSWTRQNMPAQLKLIAENPGGPTAQAIHATNDLHQKEGFEPPNIAEGIGAPIGGRTAEGNQRFLTTLGLPFEDAFGDLGVGQGSMSRNVGRTIENVMSEMNPLIKGPAELATGKQFYSGRDLNDLYGPTEQAEKKLAEWGLLDPSQVHGNTLADQLIMNSPISRLYTTARTLADERKGLDAKLFNMLGPGRVSDVDMNKARQVSGRELLEDLLRQDSNIKQFERFYVPQDKAQNVTPQEALMMRLESSLVEDAQKASLQKKAAAGDQKAKHQLDLLNARQQARVGIR